MYYFIHFCIHHYIELVIFLIFPMVSKIGDHNGLLGMYSLIKWGTLVISWGMGPIREKYVKYKFFEFLILLFSWGRRLRKMFIPRERLIKLTMSPIITRMMTKRDFFETYKYDNLLASQTLIFVRKFTHIRNQQFFRSPCCLGSGLVCFLKDYF